MNRLFLFFMAVVSLITDLSAITCIKFPADGTSPAPGGVLYEAENAARSGKVKIARSKSCSGSYFVFGFYGDDDSLSFNISVDDDGLYNLEFVTAGINGEKENFVLVDGRHAGRIKSKSSVFSKSSVSAVELTKGSHTVTVAKEWGYICVDSLSVTAYEAPGDDIYNVTATLTNKSSTPQTVALYDYLKSIYGKYTLAGQYADGGMSSNEFAAIKEITGTLPAVLGLDMMNYTPVRVAHGAKSEAVEKAVEFHNAGGIVTFCWHWSTPDRYVTGTDDENGEPLWWRSFYTENTNIDIEKIMNGEDKAGLDALNKDIEAISIQLKELEKSGIPVLWRPLHEPDGGWFWWGAKGPGAYKKLWIHLYNELTYTYKCNNLIWVFNSNSPEWYPGDEYVDIVSTDIYAQQHNYSPSVDEFLKTACVSGEKKPVALAENGVVYSSSLASQANVHWLFFATWQGEFAVENGIYSNEYTEADTLKSTYASQDVLTLDEITNR